MQPRTLLLALPLLLCGFSASPAAAALLGYWNFDSAGAFLQDASGNGHHATSLGGNSDDGFDGATSALGGGSAKFVTGGGAGFQIQLPASLASQFTNQGSISLWVKRTVATPTGDNGSGLMDLSIGGNAATHYPYTAGTGYFGEFRDNRVDNVSLTPVNRTDWHHLAIVADESGGTGASRYSVYQDGVPVVNNLADTFNFTYGATYGGVARLGMSHTGGTAGVAFLGNLDDVSLYNQPLSQTQVTLLAAGHAPQQVVNGPPLVGISLADIVGGGNGKGTGVAGAGIAMGAVNTFVPSAHPLIDGVVLPDGNGGVSSVPVSSTGIFASGIADSTGESYDQIRNGHNNLVSSSLNFDTVIGAHASKGITFDLDAILADNPGTELSRFLGYAATGNNAGSGDGVTYYVLVDGEIRESVSLTGSNAFSLLDVPLVNGDRFLTLLTLSGSNANSDWSYFGNPQVLLTVVPEPSTWLLTALGLLGVVAHHWRRTQSGKGKTLARSRQAGSPA